MSEVKRLTKSMLGLHRWAGLILGWLLFAIFFTGTLTVFDKEISWWMQPELPPAEVDKQQALTFAETWFRQNHPGADLWSISLPSEREPVLGLRTTKDRHDPEQHFNPETGEEVSARDTMGGNLFFRFHFSLNSGKGLGVWIVGLAAMAMLVALITALVIHKRIFKDFFLFRSFRGKRSWLDAHNVTGVLLFPFHLMITYTGLAIFVSIYSPAAIDSFYEGDFREMRAEMMVEKVKPAPAPEGPLLPLAELVEPIEKVLGEGTLARMAVEHLQGKAPTVAAFPGANSQIELIKGRHIHFAGSTGEPLEQEAQSKTSATVQQVMSGLHFAQFGGYPMRWLYFICGLVSCGMIATGLVLYRISLQRQLTPGMPQPTWHRVVDTCNVAFMAGIALASIAYLWSNRIIPADSVDRSVWEVRVFFAVWFMSLIHAWYRTGKQAWREQLTLLACLCITLPAVGGWSVGYLDNMRLGVEITSGVVGLAMVGILWPMRRLREVTA